MVHLASVPNDKAKDAPLVKGLDDLKLEPNSQEDEATASVYGSRFAAECLPLHEMPEDEMPKEIAYRMIRDDLSLDGNPMLNLASFVTTYMVSFPPASFVEPNLAAQGFHTCNAKKRFCTTVLMFIVVVRRKEKWRN